VFVYVKGAFVGVINKKLKQIMLNM